MGPSGSIIYLILFIKYEPSIVSKNKKQHRVAEKISDFPTPECVGVEFLVETSEIL